MIGSFIQHLCSKWISLLICLYTFAQIFAQFLLTEFYPSKTNHFKHFKLLELILSAELVDTNFSQYWKLYCFVFSQSSVISFVLFKKNVLQKCLSTRFTTARPTYVLKKSLRQKTQNLLTDANRSTDSKRKPFLWG